MPDVYPRGLLFTPGGKPVSVGVINPKHPIRQMKRNFLVPLVDESGIKVIAECAKEAVNNNRDCMIEWTGWRGVGKSTGILKAALEIDPALSTDKIAFWIDDITRLFATNPQGHGPRNGEPGLYSQIISDETG